jgi:hypothetical protein
VKNILRCLSAQIYLNKALGVCFGVDIALFIRSLIYDLFLAVMTQSSLSYEMVLGHV